MCTDPTVLKAIVPAQPLLGIAIVQGICKIIAAIRSTFISRQKADANHFHFYFCDGLLSKPALHHWQLELNSTRRLSRQLNGNC
eukprot:3937896-Pleurochrysis_carterae.AAC.1